MAEQGLPANFILFNTEKTKNPVIIVSIDGLDNLLANRVFNTQIRYGDPGLVYGAPGLVYGGLRPYEVFDENGNLRRSLPYLSLEGSSLTISQRLEPEQGKASVSTFTLAFIDYQGYMTQVVSPGVLLDEILGKEVNIYLGYLETSFPDDYFRVFRGYISSVDDGPGIIRLQLSDPNIKRRQQLFFIAQTVTTGSIGVSDQTINVLSTDNFFQQVYAPNPTTADIQSVYTPDNPSVHTYINIDNEWIEAVPLVPPTAAYGSLVVNGLIYFSAAGAGVTIRYTSGGTAGSEVVTVVGAAITVQIQVGVSTPLTISSRITATPAAHALVSNKVLPPLVATTQTTMSATPLVDSTSGSQFAVIARGARGTTAATHDPGATVSAGIQLGDSVFTENSIDMALKIMLSGWDGPWISGVAISSVGPNPDPIPSDPTTDYVVLPVGVDAVQDYGLTAGDFVNIVGGAIPGNNNRDLEIVRFGALGGQNNRVIFIDTTLSGTLTKEYPTTATVSFRSQYDVYPVEAGLKLTPKDVDILQHLYIRNTFLGLSGNDYIFFITQAESSGKDFLELQIYFPAGAYSLTRRGKLSCGYHSPPLAGQNLVVLNAENVIEPSRITIGRALNSRAFYNEIDITYDYDNSGTPQSVQKIIDIDSLNIIGLTNTLPIDARGIYSGFSSALLQKRAFFLLTRYKRGAAIIDLTVNFGVGCTTEAGDVIAINDPNGILQIANFTTGQRNLNGQLFEVIDRTLDIATGNTKIKGVGSVGATINDRFATISPSSKVGVGSTNTQLIIKDSYGALYPGDESLKWANYINENIMVRSFDYSTSVVVRLLSIDPVNNYLLNVEDMGFSPPENYIVGIPTYGTGVDPTINAKYKLYHAFLDPTVNVVSASDNTHFTVSGGDIAKFHVGAPIRVHSFSYSTDSGDLTVAGISGNIVQTSASMGFTPVANDLVDLIGFADFNVTTGAGQPYRLI